MQLQGTSMNGMKSYENPSARLTRLPHLPETLPTNATRRHGLYDMPDRRSLDEVICDVLEELQFALFRKLPPPAPTPPPSPPPELAVPQMPEILDVPGMNRASPFRASVFLGSCQVACGQKGAI